MNKKLRKGIAIFITTVFLLSQNFSVTTALAAPDLPDLPDNSEEQSEPEDSNNDQEEVVEDNSPDLPDTPDAPDNANQNDDSEDDQEDSNNEENSEDEEEDIEYTTAEDLDVEDAPQAPKVDTDSGDNNSGDQNQDGQMGGATIDTGNAAGTGAILNTGNTNVASEDGGASVSGTDADVAIVNSGNGENSNNDASVALEENSITIQDNDANIDNELEVDVNSGNNSASGNTGGNNSIDTGNAIAVGTIVNSVNTNVAGAMVSEFNVTDDQVGDLVLDYEANCVSGCGSNINLQNKNNGSDSNNNSEVDIVNNESTFQNNDAAVENDLILTADTGNNTTNSNTGGNNSIDTGNATVNGNVINMLNNNIAGNVIYGVVNIIDDFVGNIIVPEKYASAYTANDISIDNSGNGSGSENNGEVLIADSESFTQYNDADIVNNLIIDANTGGNETSSNTSGNNDIDTGNVNVDASILNIANNNVVGGDWWIVLVNEAGNWIGKIFTPQGALNGGNFAVAGGQSSVDPETGAITLSNNGNGDDSVNNASVSQENNSETVQTNNAKIVNNIELTANTGNNSASRNTGGSNEIDTGNATVQFNLINFVNNNFAGGNVYLTIVNVLGSWTGDFVTPDSDHNNSDDDNENSEDNNNGIGGSNDVANNSSSSNADNNSNSSGSNSSSNQSVLAAKSSSNDYDPYGWGTGGSVLASAESDEDEFELVETASASNGEETSSKRKINLAWALLLLPAYIVVRTVRKRFLS